jgi:hypothetical protein
MAIWRKFISRLVCVRHYYGHFVWALTAVSSLYLSWRLCETCRTPSTLCCVSEAACNAYVRLVPLCKESFAPPLRTAAPTAKKTAPATTTAIRLEQATSDARTFPSSRLSLNRSHARSLSLSLSQRFHFAGAPQTLTAPWRS